MTRFFWSSRLANDPPSPWIRDLVVQTYIEVHEEAEQMVERALSSAPG